ncbi:MAG TPA: hypothetical protein VLR49_01755 [Ferruginibacter sp.]|nr:hypothetical protein [Ferruginibacter sp.]
MPFQDLYKTIFNKDESDAGGNAMLHQLVKEYPYFSLAHFFILKNTDIKNDSYNSIAAKTALHFNHPFLLQEQLHKNTELVLEEALNEVLLVTKKEEEFVIADSPEAPIVPVEVVETIETIETIPVNETTSPETPENADLKSEAIIEENVINEEEPAAMVKEEPIIFQPLFASDYFASQGIKLSQEALPTDKLGKQLKSFTDWLKTMKKVHDNKLPDSNEAMDVSVQTLAEKSNKEEDVITETMAEVYLQQGKRHKAKEIYEKLSLLNPSKIAYFAAKLDQIQ